MNIADCQLMIADWPLRRLLGSRSGTNWQLAIENRQFSERCRSGLTGSTGNAVNGEPFRGFESHPFRHVSEARASARARSATGLSYGRVSDTRLSTGPDATI